MALYVNSKIDYLLNLFEIFFIFGIISGWTKFYGANSNEFCKKENIWKKYDIVYELYIYIEQKYALKME